MKLDVVYSKNLEEMNNNMDKLEDIGFHKNSSGDNYILAKKRVYGNIYIHLLIIVIALLFFAPIIFLNVIYFGYNIFKNSRFVLLTSEKKDEEGNDLEFVNFDKLLKEKWDD